MEISLHAVDYRRLPDKFAEEFDAVVCWSASRFCARDRRRRRAQGVLEYAKHSLQRGGLVMDQGITDGLYVGSGRFSLNRSSSEVTRLSVVDFFK